MLLTLLVTLIILLGFWSLYRAFGSRSNNPVERFLHKNFPAGKKKLDTTLRQLRNQPGFLSKVPMVFTQPHLLPPHFSKEEEEQHSLEGADIVNQKLNDKAVDAMKNATGIEILRTKTNKSDVTANTDLRNPKQYHRNEIPETARNIDTEFSPTRLFTLPSYHDDLKQIKGIGKVMERTLNELGITTFKQLSEFESNDIERISNALSVFPGRIERDEWIKQARYFHELNNSEIMDT